MTEQSYLNPTAIREQCALAVRHLEEDNESLRTAENSINSFAQAEELKGAAFEALKQQLADYREAVQAIRSANEADIADFRTLAGAVGEEVLIGENILKQQREALSAKDNFESMAREYEQNANTMSDWRMAGHCRNLAWCYWDLADRNRQLYEEWKAKEEAYDSIEAATAGLFGTGEDIRTAALHALEAIRGAFAGGTYRPDMEASWRGELEAGYRNRVASFSDDGEMTVNWCEVEKILEKEAGNITDGEYKALTFAFLNMDGDELGRFLQCLMGEREDVGGALVRKLAGGPQYIASDYSEWTVDTVKVERILSCAELTSELLLYMQQEARKEPDGGGRCSGFAMQRDTVLQRMTLLGVVAEIGKFRGGYKKEYPQITVSAGEEGELTLCFCQYRTYSSAFSFVMEDLGKATVVVGKTEASSFLDNDAASKVKYRLASYFGSYPITEEIAGFAEGEAIGVGAGRGMDALSSYVKNELGKETLGETLGIVIPVFGDMAAFAFEAMQDEMQADADAAFIVKQFAVVEAAAVYSDFGCCANFVQYDVEGNDNVVIRAYAGERTDAIIEQINSEFGTSLNRQQLLLNPEEAWECIEEIRAQDGARRLDEIFNNL